MKKIRQNLKTHISGTVRQIQLKFGIRSAPAEEILQKNILCFCSGHLELLMCQNNV